jgi:hypothetical protein
LAFREGSHLRAAVIDTLDGLSLDDLRPSLESSSVVKAIHNAAFDATRLSRHFRVHTSPIHDTMLAARRGGEKRYSLQAQTQTHLGFQLDKSEQRGDWSRRPLNLKQLRYAALDAVCTLLLYENQIARKLSASYRLRETFHSTQTSLPLSEATAVAKELPATGQVDLSDLAHTESIAAERLSGAEKLSGAERLSAPVLALLGVATELTGRYSPERLAVSANSERVGLAGWIIDGVLGAEADIDEETARLGIAELLEREFVSLNEARRLEATEAGRRLWTRLKPA